MASNDITACNQRPHERNDKISNQYAPPQGILSIFHAGNYLQNCLSMNFESFLLSFVIFIF